MEMRLELAQSNEQISYIKELFEEYRQTLPIDLCFQNYQEELIDLPGKYAPPDGRLYLAYMNDHLAGCIGLRSIPESDCELKRLYVREEYRGHGIGRQLSEQVINDAKTIGYKHIYLDTLSSMEHAINLYESLGFKRCKSYYNNPNATTVYMMLKRSQYVIKKT